MHIISIEVIARKTSYKIIFNWKEILDAKKQFNNEPQNILDKYKLAFGGLGSGYTDSDIFNLLKLNPYFYTKNDTAIAVATLKYIFTQYFKFDGITRWGIGDEKGYFIELYKYGDFINLPFEEGGKTYGIS